MTRTTSRFELPIPLEYIETTIPAGMTIAEYRRSRPPRTSWWRSLGWLRRSER
jgi:hypothetical protein